MRRPRGVNRNSTAGCRPGGALPADWRAYSAPDELARLGEAWRREMRTAILSVPSVVIPQEPQSRGEPAARDFSKLQWDTAQLRAAARGALWFDENEATPIRATVLAAQIRSACAPSLALH
jgi:hypothetical protein